MKTVRDVLQKYVGAAPPLVEAGSDETGRLVTPLRPTLDRDALKRDLKAVRESNNLWFTVCVALLVALFCVTLGLIVSDLNRPGLVSAAVPVLGISSAGLVTMMLRMWRSKSAAEYLIVLASNMDELTLETVIAVLAKHV